MTPEALQYEVERFLYLEAGLIDERRFRERLDLFTDDALYWLPADEEAPKGGPQTSSIVYEDRAGIEKRIVRIEHPSTLTELPPRRTRHFISNVVVSPRAEGEVLVASNQIVYSVRLGAEVQYPAPGSTFCGASAMSFGSDRRKFAC